MSLKSSILRGIPAVVAGRVHSFSTPALLLSRSWMLSRPLSVTPNRNAFDAPNPTERHATVDELFQGEEEGESRGGGKRNDWDRFNKQRVSGSFSNDFPKRQPNTGGKKGTYSLSHLDYNQRKYKLIIAGIKMASKNKEEIKPAVEAFFDQALQMGLPNGEHFITDVGRFSDGEHASTVVTLSTTFAVLEAIKRARAQGPEGFMFGGQRCYVRPCYSVSQYRKRREGRGQMRQNQNAAVEQ